MGDASGYGYHGDFFSTSLYLIFTSVRGLEAGKSLQPGNKLTFSFTLSSSFLPLPSPPRLYDPTTLYSSSSDGWDRDVLQTAIDTCTSDSGIIEYCSSPLLSPSPSSPLLTDGPPHSGTVFDLYDTDHQCRQTPQVDEVVTGLLTKLPGCNPVTGAGPNATPCSATSTPTVVQNAVYTGAAPPVGVVVPANEPTVVTTYTNPGTGHTYKWQDCYSDNVNGARVLPNGISNANSTIEGASFSSSQPFSLLFPFSPFLRRRMR
jgi:hypothetical protein